MILKGGVEKIGQVKTTKSEKKRGRGARESKRNGEKINIIHKKNRQKIMKLIKHRRNRYCWKLKKGEAGGNQNMI